MNKIDSFIQRAQSLGNKATWVTLKEGKNVLRFLSRPGDVNITRSECYRHFLRDYDVPEDFSKAPVCLGEDCPGCKLVEELRKRGEEKKANAVQAQARFIFAVFYRDSPNNEAGELCIKNYEAPPTAFQKLGKILQEWEEDFTDIDKGYDIEITKTSGAFTKYDAFPVTTRDKGTMSLVYSPLTDEEKYLVENSFPDLDNEITPPDREMFEAVLAGILDEPPVSVPRRTTGPATSPGARPKPPVPVPSDTVSCPKFGEYDVSMEECRECAVAEECKAKTTERTASRTPLRRSV